MKLEISFSRFLLLGLAVFCAGCAATPSADHSSARLLREAQKKKPDQAVGLYLSAAERALALASDKSAPAGERAEAVQIYNQAVAGGVLALQKQDLLPQGGGTARVFPGAGEAYQLRITRSGGQKNPADFDRLIASEKISRKHLKADIERGGLGGTFVAVKGKARMPALYQPQKGFAEPVTAIATFGKGTKAGTPVELAFFDPRTKEKIAADGATFPVAGDFTAPLAYFPRAGLPFGIAAMFFSEITARRAGLYFCEPYDPDKIPVVFVHGLMSSPHAWLSFINELNRDPEFRRRYQPWVFFYPSGAPIAGTALLLRRSLADVASHYPLKRNIVLIGHSMGGILSRLQVTDSGDKLWNELFGERADEVRREFPDDSLLKRALIFRANPYVSRVIFIATPHRGSDLATLRISALAASLIRLPVILVKQIDTKMRAVLQGIDPSLRSAPNSITGLSPKSKLLQSVSKLEIAVPYYCIIGNRGRDSGPLADSSDGVVPYWSSHLDGAQSETIVPTGHDAFNCPQAVDEVLHILEEK